MESFQVTAAGPFARPLEGTVRVGGAKNSALKLMAATLLAEGDYVLRNVPRITDVENDGPVPRGTFADVAFHFDPCSEGGFSLVAYFQISISCRTARTASFAAASKISSF